MSSTWKEEELEKERRYVAKLYSALDAEKEEAAAHLETEGADDAQGSLWERDAVAEHWFRRLTQLKGAEQGLCFGRMDRQDDQPSYIGRTGLFDDALDEPLLTDWRAPAARPFYCATAATPEALWRRRHFRTRARSVLDFHDDVLTSGTQGYGAVGADSALISALEMPRGSSMHDIVSTIQAEQDEIIRLDHSGVLVIEGGPGTGKTAVALHRIAFLFYHHRERLAKRGVLVVGPSSGFLRYIGSVLPSLGETDVVFVTPGELHPGVEATVEDEPEVARIKGEVAMVEVLCRAVADRQELPGEPVEIALDDVTLEVGDALAAEARERARATGLQHNPARRAFREHLGALLVQQALDRIGEGWLAQDDSSDLAADLTADVRAELREHPDFHAAVERLWPALTSAQLLADLFTSPERLLAAAGGDDALSTLYREEGSAWTVSDAPLLDEAVEFLGEDTVEQQRQDRRQAEAQREYTQGVLQILDSHDDADDGVLRASDVVDAAELAERQTETERRTLAERAVADRNWTYGHLVVDEAHELSPMTWRVLMRRCPSRSATIAGDLVQRRSPAADVNWSSALRPHVGDRWCYRRLSVNYRTPVEIMNIAAGLVRSVGPEIPVPRSVRHGDKPWRCQVAGDELAKAVETSVADQVAAYDDRSIAVIAAETTLQCIAVPGAATALTPRTAKGLEFDMVIVLSPDEILHAGPHGVADLYVALTRATRGLGLLHTAPLPGELSDDDLWVVKQSVR